MSTYDPQRRRLDAARTYVTGASAADEVGVIDFDSSAIIRSPVVLVGPNRDALLAAIGQIDASGGTNLGAGLQAGCDALQSATAGRRAAIFLTDGQGSYSGQSSCFADNGWPVFTIGLGSGVDASLLQQIANETGGEYRSLASATNLVCEFQRIRSLVAGVAASTCEPTADIVQGQTVSLFQTVRSFLSQITFTNTWLGSDIEMTVTSPSGQVFNRSSSGDGVSASYGPTFESITVLDPEAGEWSVSFYGAEIPDGGEPFTFSTSPIELPDDQIDSDNDGLTDPLDNCPYHENPLQEDFDGDGFGDVCDTDPGLVDPSPVPVPVPVPVPTPGAPAQPQVDRVWGADRIATAVAVSRGSFGAASAPVVVIARSDGFADALAAVPLAVSLGGPLLLTNPNSLNSEVAAELARVVAPDGRVIIVGGVGAVARAVEDELVAAGHVVQRLQGADRYSTAVEVAAELPSPEVIIVATGTEFADALSGGVAAAAAKGVVILSNGDLLPEVSADFIDMHPGVRVVALGGPAAAAAESVPGVVPLVGANRYATAVLAANEFFSSPAGAGVASGVDFPDSLAGGAAIAASGWPMLLTAPDSLPSAVDQWLREQSPQSVRVFGGSAAVSEQVAAELTAAVR